MICAGSRPACASGNGIAAIGECSAIGDCGRVSLAEARGGGSGTAGGSGSGSGAKGTAAAPSFPARTASATASGRSNHFSKEANSPAETKTIGLRTGHYISRASAPQTEVRNTPPVATQPFVAGVGGGGSATAVAPALAPVQYSSITSTADFYPTFCIRRKKL